MESTVYTRKTEEPRVREKRAAHGGDSMLTGA